MKEQTPNELTGSLYKLQWFAERSGEWRDAGFSSRFLPPVQDKMRDDRILCSDTVTFRIVSTIA